MNKDDNGCVVIRSLRKGDIPGEHCIFSLENENWHEKSIQTELPCAIQYGEFNTLYWIWKKCEGENIIYLSDGEYPIVTNTKQFNEEKIAIEAVDQLIDRDQMVFIEKRSLQRTFGEEIRSRLFAADELTVLMDEMCACKPGMKRNVLEVLRGTDAYMSLSFAMKKEQFNDMATFIFEYLRCIEDKIRSDKYPKKYANALETLGLFLMNVYIHIQMESGRNILEFSGGKIKEEDVKDEFTYAYNKEEVVIILSSSDYFSPYLGVCIQSILENTNKEFNYDIVVFEREISAENKLKILELVQSFDNVSVRFFNIRREVKKYNFFVNSPRISQETYYGLLIPWFLPNFDKAIIMDCDMIAKQDLAELYYLDLGDNIGGGVRDVVLQGWLNDRNNDTSQYYEDVVHAKNPFTFVNGGLILLDFKKYRDEITPDMVLFYLNNFKFRVVDQDIFNLLLEGRMMALDPKWNHMIYLQGAISMAIDNAPMSSQAEYFTAKKNPGIIHYASENKPWLNPSIEFASEFWKCARKTPFYEEILFRMMSNNQSGLSQQQIQTAYVQDQRTVARRLADLVLPKGTKRRNVLKRILPKDTRRWKVLKKIYFAMFPQYNPNNINRNE